MVYSRVYPRRNLAGKPMLTLVVIHVVVVRAILVSLEGFLGPGAVFSRRRPLL